MSDMLLNDNKTPWKVIRGCVSAVDTPITGGLQDFYPADVHKLPQVASLIKLGGFCPDSVASGTAFSFRIYGFRKGSKFAERIAVIAASAGTSLINKNLADDSAFAGRMLSSFSITTDYWSTDSGAAMDVTLNQSADQAGFMLLDTFGIERIFIEKISGVGEVTLIYTSTTR